MNDYENVDTWDLTPEVFQDDAMCETCGHFSRIIANVNRDTGYVEYDDNVSCYGGEQFAGTASGFIQWVEDNQLEEDAGELVSYLKENFND